jgi:GNAT superfamily N-acetyltransferase
MHVVVFRDRCARIIRIVFDETCMHAVAHRGDEAVGELSLYAGGMAEDTLDSETPVMLAGLYVKPAYRRAGIAHTLLACACRELGRPIRIDPKAWPDSTACATLRRCLAIEGIVVADTSNIN